MLPAGTASLAVSRNMLCGVARSFTTVLLSWGITLLFASWFFLVWHLSFSSSDSVVLFLLVLIVMSSVLWFDGYCFLLWSWDSGFTCLRASCANALRSYSHWKCVVRFLLFSIFAGLSFAASFNLFQGESLIELWFVRLSAA